MKRTVVCCLLCLGVLFFAGCVRDDHPTTPAAVEPSSPECGVDPAAIAGQIVAATGWETDSDAIVPVERPQSGRPVHPGELFDWGREILWSDVAHYWWDIPVGSGTYDRIRLHRVVRERRPNKPIHTSEAVFLQHGAFVGFVKFIFGSASPGTPDDHSAAVYLARNDIDVWGIDQNWALVPAGTTDFSFMEDWGIQNQVDNLDVAISIARDVRAFTGSGHTKVKLLGYSSGVTIGYALLSEETQRPPGQRNVDGFIPVDQAWKFSSEFDEIRQGFCASIDDYQAMLDAGLFQIDFGVVMAMAGTLARTDPGGDSPIVPGFTNEQVLLLLFVTPGGDTPWMHFFAGIFESEFPVGSRFTTVQAIAEFAETASPYIPTRLGYDFAVTNCGEVDVPFDDHLGEIRVPILHIAAAGGWGRPGYATLDYLGSVDKEILTIQFFPDDEAWMDFGHVDLWTATSGGGDASVLVWRPLTDWILAH